MCTKKVGPFLTVPSPFGIQSKPNVLLTYEFVIFVYSILERKDMIGIGIIAQDLFSHL